PRRQPPRHGRLPRAGDQRPESDRGPRPLAPAGPPPLPMGAEPAERLTGRDKPRARPGAGTHAVGVPAPAGLPWGGVSRQCEILEMKAYQKTIEIKPGFPDSSRPRVGPGRSRWFGPPATGPGRPLRPKVEGAKPRRAG